MAPDLTPEELLRQTPLFRTLDRRVQADLAAQVQYRTFRDGDVIIEAGASGRTLLLMLRGTAEVFAREGASRLRLSVLQPGALFGEISFFSPTASRTADVVGKEPGMLAILSTELYTGLCRSNPAAAAALEKAVLTLLADRLEETNRMMAGLMDDFRSSGIQAALGWLSRLFGGKE